MCPQGESAQSLAGPKHDQSSSDPPDLLPQDEISRGAYNLARTNLPTPILNHSVRVYLVAKQIAENEHSRWLSPEKLPLLLVACILHDAGCASAYDGFQRFEVEGADSAAKYLSAFGVGPADTHEVWQAIALHTSSGIAERISELARILRTAVLIDFGKPYGNSGKISAPVSDGKANAGLELRDFEHSFPRLEIEKVLGDVVVAQALRKREKAPAASWPGILLRAKLENPDWDGVNKAF